jgi:hypothetical protein
MRVSIQFRLPFAPYSLASDALIFHQFLLLGFSSRNKTLENPTRNQMRPKVDPVHNRILFIGEGLVNSALSHRNSRVIPRT